MNTVPILLMTCHNYRDAWYPFYFFLDKYFTDYSYKVYHVTDEPGYEDFVPKKENIVPIISSQKAWSSMLIEAMNIIGEDQVLFLLEDYLITDFPDKSKMYKAFQLFKEVKNLKAIKLSPFPPANGIVVDVFGELLPGTEFRMSCMPGIWDRRFILEVARIGESAWEFERNATARSNQLNVVLYGMSSGQFLIKYIGHTAILNGLWSREAYLYCLRNGIKLDLEFRPIRSKWYGFYKEKAPNWLRHIMDFINTRTISWFQTDLRIYNKHAVL